MVTIQQTDDFRDWLHGLKDGLTRARLVARLRKVANGNFGDHKSVGDGVFELRETFGPGWRMYYLQRGETIVVMLGGGDKSTQSKDIAHAKKLAQQVGEL